MALLLFILFNFGPPIYWGYVGGAIIGPLAWSVAWAIFAVSTGWRAPAPVKGVLASALIATCFAAAANLPIYFIGRWLVSIP